MQSLIQNDHVGVMAPRQTPSRIICHQKKNKREKIIHRILPTGKDHLTGGRQGHIEQPSLSGVDGRNPG